MRVTSAAFSGEACPRTWSGVETGSRDETSVPIQSERRSSGPGARGLCLRLIGVDRGLLLHGEADVVETVHQAVLAERVDLERPGAAVGPADFLLAEIDGQCRIGAAFGI